MYSYNYNFEPYTYTGSNSSYLCYGKENTYQIVYNFQGIFRYKPYLNKLMNLKHKNLFRIDGIVYFIFHVFTKSVLLVPGTKEAFWQNYTKQTLYL